MFGIKFHWWVIAGIIVGAIIGTVLNHTYSDEARQSVLGASYTAADVQAHAKEINDTLAKMVKQSVVGGALDVVARVFMNLLKMIVLPLVFFSLTLGISSLGSAQRVGRVGVRTAIYYFTTSFIAILVGVALVNLIQPGTGIQVTVPTSAPSVQPPDSFLDIVISMVPSNPIASAAQNPPDMFGVIFFSLLFGIFMTMVPDEKRAPMCGFIDSGFEVMMRMTGFVISLAPVGIMALVAFTVSTSGPEVFVALLPYVLTVAAALAIHAFVTLPLVVWFFARRNAFVYMKAMSPALLTGFSTASSAGTLAVTMEHAQKKAGISTRITNFVLPLGASVNMDGTGLYECVTVLFIAQLHAATHPEFAPLSIGSQFLVVFLTLAVSLGAAGIPHAGLVMMVIILNAVGLPLEYTALIWAVDRLLDMIRTTVNIWGDSCGALVVAASENEVDDTVLFARR